MAACCSSICATITGSPNAWSIRIRPPSRRPRSCARNSSSGSTARCASARPAPRTPRCRRASIEVYVREIEVLGPAGDLPMPVFGDQPYPEDTRLKYRFLDLRREKLHANIMLRGRIIDSLRARMKAQGLLRVPDADPDRLEPRGRARLSGSLAPASRQVLCAAAGAAAVQAAAPWWRASTAISRSRRASATRTRAPTASPGEFYQLDIEMSFVTQEDVFAAVEPVLRGVFEEFGGGKPVTQGLPDDPLRRGDAGIRRRQAGPAQSDHDRRRDRGVRARGRDLQRLQAGDQGRRGRARDPRAGRGRSSRARSSTSSTTGRRGRARRVSATSFSRARASALAGKGPIAKFLPAEAQKALVAKAKLSAGDAVFFACDKADKAAKLAGAARIRIGADLGLSQDRRVRILLDRRLPDVRVERGREEDRLLPQSRSRCRRAASRRSRARTR